MLMLYVDVLLQSHLLPLSVMSTPSVLDYARFHGLAVDHTEEDLFEYLPDLAYQSTHYSVDASLLDPDFAFLCHRVDEGAHLLGPSTDAVLAGSTKHEHPGIVWDDMLRECHRVGRLKIEEPMLAGDHETEVSKFKKSANYYSANVEELLKQCTRINSPIEDFNHERDDITSGRSLQLVQEELAGEVVNNAKESSALLSVILDHTLTDREKDDGVRQGLVYIRKVSFWRFAF
jgi:hypothetical protein